jgi:exosortase/archaeosortase family protein
MTFISVAIAVAFLSQRPFWQRVIVSISAIPIAIFCNVMRVTGTGLLYRYEGPDWAEGFTHQFVGLIMLVPAFFMILSVCWVLDHLFVEELDAAGAPVRKVGRGGPPSSGVPAVPGATVRLNRQPGGPRRRLGGAADGGAA